MTKIGNCGEMSPPWSKAFFIAIKTNSSHTFSLSSLRFEVIKTVLAPCFFAWRTASTTLALAETEIVVFDKTGTLTKGVFNVQEIHPEGVSKEELLELTAHAESYSNHPISLSLKRAYSKEIDNGRISDVEEISGHGVIATVDGKKVMAGNINLMKMMDIPYFKGELIGTIVHVAVNNKYIGYIVIADEVKEDSAQAIKELKAANIKKTVDNHYHLIFSTN